MRRIHSAPLSEALELGVPREVFGVKWLADMDRVAAIISRGDFRSPGAAQLARCWREAVG